MRATIIGAGPAGLSAALGLLRVGKRVRVIDERVKPGGRVCGGYLNAEACRQLEWLGVLDEIKNESAPVSAVILSTPQAHSQFPASHNEQETLGISRDILEEILLKEVIKLGGEVEWGKRVTNVDEIDGFVIVACGRFGLSKKRTRGDWYGWSAHFIESKIPKGTLALHFHQQGYIGLLVLKDGTLNVCGLSHREDKTPFSIEKTFDDAHEAQPHFREAMLGAKRVNQWRAVGPLPYGAWISEQDPFFAVGDAAAVGDPFMGEGLGRALGAGPMLAETFSQTEIPQPRDYVRKWRSAYGGRFRLGLLARPLIAPGWRWLALNSLIKHPSLIQKVMPVFQTGYQARTPSDFCKSSVS